MSSIKNETDLYTDASRRPIDALTGTSQLPQEFPDSLQYLRSFNKEQNDLRAFVRAPRAATASQSGATFVQGSSAPSNSNPSRS